MTGLRRELAPLGAANFDTIRRLVLEECGISLHEGKISLVSSRLERLVRKYNFDSFDEYIHFLLTRRSRDEFSEFIDHLTTNHSGFWREPEHFAFLSRVILPGRKNGLRIWSAACATGEEPYTIAMCCLESKVQGHISASDISNTALAAAARGEFPESRLAALPPGWRERYFERVEPEKNLWRIGRMARAAVRFGAFNLLHPLVAAGQFDAIFCRNVMIYFDQATRDDLVSRLVAQLVPGGHLFTGHSETLLRLPRGLAYVQPATYRKDQ